MRLLLLLVGFTLTASADNYYVVIAGLGGTPEYEAQFEKWAQDLDHEVRASGPGANVSTLFGAAVSRQKVGQLFSTLAGSVKSDDAFTLLLIGHGSFDGTEYKFNIPGPDMTATELAAAMNRIPASRQLVVNMTSCSGASFAALARKGRIVVTATKSGNEKNAPVFARFFVDALRDPVADTDKNGTVSALEAFRYTEHKVNSYFDTEKLLATEHPLFSDTGSSTGVREVKPDAAEGKLAAAFPLVRPATESAQASSPERQALVLKKQDLEAKIDRLKFQKSAMEEQAYKQQLTALLLELARTQAEIDR